MATKKSGLGKGLEALFADNASDEVAVHSLRLSEIEPNREQPRRQFDEAALAELAESIRQYGVIQPIAVRPLPSGGYQIVAGERRWRAARMAELTEVPVVILELDDAETMQLALVENLQREDLNPMEEAEGFQTLADRFGLTQEQIAQKVGRSRPAVANAMRLLALPESVRRMVESGTLSAGHARTLLTLPDPAQMLALARQAIEQGLTVRALEKLVAQQTGGAKSRSGKPALPVYYREVSASLTETLSRPVKVERSGRVGRLIVEFYSDEELGDLANRLGNI